MPLKPHEWPFTLQKRASKTFKTRRFRAGTFKVRSSRGFSRQENQGNALLQDIDRVSADNIFLYCGRPEDVRQFLLFVEQNQLGEKYLKYSGIWGHRILCQFEPIFGKKKTEKLLSSSPSPKLIALRKNVCL